MNVAGEVTRRRRRRGAVAVSVADCKNEANQLWVEYENGELVNTASGECAYASGNDNNIRTQPCNYHEHHRWSAHSFSANIDKMSYANTGHSNQCLDTKNTAGTGSLRTRPCADTDPQTWSWRPTGWLTPVGQWTQIGCHENGPLTYKYTQNVESSNTVTEETSTTIGFAIESGTQFNKVKVSTEISRSLEHLLVALSQ